MRYKDINPNISFKTPHSLTILITRIYYLLWYKTKTKDKSGFIFYPLLSTPNAALDPRLQNIDIGCDNL